MKAAILDNGKLEIRDVPKPEPGYEEALIKISTAGVCHTDLHLAKGDWPQFGRPAAVALGHEGIGVVEALGPGAEKYVNINDRVILGLGGAGGAYWCGACEFCLSGRPRLCKEMKSLRGTYAEFIAVWAKALVKLPEAVSDQEVPLACGGLTAYSAIKKLFRFDVLPGKTLAIIGAAGGLGHYAIQIAKAFGYKVVGVDVGQEKLDFIKSLGADYAVDAAEASQLVRKQLGGAHAAIVFTPKLAGFELGLKLLRRGALFIGVGMPASSEGALSLAPLDLMAKDPIIMYSTVGTVEEMRELVQIAADGKVKTHISRVASLSELSKVFDELEKGAYLGRALLNDMTK